MKILNLTAQAPERPRWQKTEDGFLRCPARVLAHCVMPYLREELAEATEDLPEYIGEQINMYVPQWSLTDPEALHTLEGAPIVIGDHSWLTPEVIKEYGMGHVAGTPRLDGDYLEVDLLVTDPQAIARIEAGELPEISAAYRAETVFEPGVFNGQPYDAVQTALRYNHIAVIPEGHGRGGRDVRILNTKQKEEKKMAFKVLLKNTGKFINVETEEDVKAVEEEGSKSAASLEKTMGDLESKNGELSAVQAEVDELKGELSVYKEKLDELLSTESIEHAADEMVQEGGEAEEILSNTAIVNEKGDEDEEKKKEIMNSLKKLHGTKLHNAVLSAVGVKTEGMSPEALKGAFKAQHQICNSMKGKGRKVAGAKMMNGIIPDQTDGGLPQQRSAHERLGFVTKK